MNGADHYREAERLLGEATSRERDPRALWCLELAKVHTALAQVAATALTADDRDWTEAADQEFRDLVIPRQEQARTLR